MERNPTIMMEKTLRQTTSILLFFIIMLFGGTLYSQEHGWHLTGPPGGIVTEIAVIPNQSNAVLAANYLYFTGVMKSTNGGESWEVLNKGLEFGVLEGGSSIHAFAVDLVFPDTMFISCVGGNYEMEFYRTHDGGVNWYKIMEDTYIRAIAAKNGRAYASPEDGGLLASYNGGVTWQNMVPFLPPVAHILFDPEDVNTIYVGTDDDGLYRIVFQSGISVEQVGFVGKEVDSFDMASCDSCKLICTAIECEGGDSVFISQDDGDSWIPRNSGLPHSDLVRAVRISPDNLDIIYAATLKGVYKSVDQGISWFPMNEGLDIPTILFPEPSSTTVLSLAIDPNNTDVVYAGTNRKGLFRTTDGGQGWNLIGIPAVSVSGLSVSPLNPKLIYAGAEDGFYVGRADKWHPTTLWGGMTSGIKSVATSPVDSNLVLATYDGALGIPQIYKSTDGGQTWEMTQTLWEDSDVADIVFDPMFPERVYGLWSYAWSDNRGGLLISDDSGDHWEIVNVDSVEQGLAAIRPLAINPQNSREMYLLGVFGTVLKSTDRTTTWEKVKTGADTVHYAIVMDPFQPENIYVSAYGIWKSTDAGETWFKTSPNEWILDLAFDENSGYLYAAAPGKGVLFTTDGGDTWDTLPPPPNPYVEIIDIGEKDEHSIIYAGTFGAGVFEWIQGITPVELPQTDYNAVIDSELLNNYPNPFNKKTFIQFRVSKSTQVSLRIINILGQVVNTLVNEYRPAGEYSTCWNGKDDSGKEVASGFYFCCLQNAGLTTTKKIVFLK